MRPHILAVWGRVTLARRRQISNGAWRELQFLLNQREPELNQHDSDGQLKQPYGNQLRGSQLFEHGSEGQQLGFVQLDQHHRSERPERRRSYDSHRDQHHDRQQRC